MKHLLIIISIALMVQSAHGQDKFAGSDVSINIFSSSASHWYGIKDKHNVINPKKNQPRYKANELEAIGDNILLYQKKNGGWPKNYDVTAILTPDQKDSMINDKGNLNTTFDNSTSYTHVAFLAKVYNATHAKRFSDATIKGIDYIIKAQYNNGGWPQYYPLEKGYSRHITYNDDAFIGIMEVLRDIKHNKPAYAFLSDDVHQKVSAAFDKGIECILNTQIKDKSGLTAWCQQHDEVTLQPAWARAFEPPSICNAESVGIVMLLMDLDKPSDRVKNAVQGAVKWFKASAIKGIIVKTVAASPDTSQYTVSHSDKVVVADVSAPQIWTRYYELETHRPLFCNRDSKVVYSLAEVARERRSGYAWYTYNPQRAINKYAGWAKKWGVAN